MASTFPANTDEKAKVAKAAHDQLVTKANETIAIRPKRGKLTLLSRRIYNALLYHAQRQGEDNARFSLPLQVLIHDARFNSNNTELLKSHLRDMQATTIEWSTSSAGQQRWVSTQLIGTVVIEEQGPGKPCTISWGYPDEIRERLLKPNQYTRVMLEISAQMRSYAAAVLYEIGARYLTSPGRLSMREDVVWWAAVLTGRSDITQVDYRFFKRDVVSKALAELDTLCEEFSLELIEHKQGRKITELQFRVVPKAQQSLGGINDPGKNLFDLELVAKLVQLGIRQEDAQDLYASTDEGQLRTALEHTQLRQRSNTLAPLKSPAAYFRDALKKGYAASAGTPKLGQGRAPEPPSNAEQLERIRSAWEAEQFHNARGLYFEQSEEIQAELRERFEAEGMKGLASPIVKLWKKDGPASPIAASSFFRWYALETWKDEVTDSVLLEFALSKGMLKLD